MNLNKLKDIFYDYFQSFARMDRNLCSFTKSLCRFVGKYEVRRLGRYKLLRND